MKLDTYPKQDADGTRHAHLPDTNNCHFVPGGLSGAAGQRSDQLLHYGGHDLCCKRRAQYTYIRVNARLENRMWCKLEPGSLEVHHLKLYMKLGQ